MIHGDGSDWLPHFRNLAERLEPHLVSVVPQCAALLGPRAGEDEMTRCLVHRLTADATVRRFAGVEYQFEPFSVDTEGRVESLGKIDLVVWAAGGWPREVYLAYECKRLSVEEPRRRSLASEYVTEGVIRFVTEQYSEALPLACMLGYVLNGDVHKATHKVQSAIRIEAQNICLVEGPRDLASRDRCNQFATTHTRARSGTRIVIRHLLVSCT